jgi:hypothetical protein
MGRAEFDATYAWLTAAARDVLWESYVENGASTMWTDVRQDPRYEEWFPGNLTEDGRPRYAEAENARTVASYDDGYRSVGIDGESFATYIHKLIEPMMVSQNVNKKTAKKTVKKTAKKAAKKK